MTYAITVNHEKARRAAEFGRELMKACKARGVPLKELERAAGVGHTTLDNYRRGLILPRTESAKAIADALDWPKLYRLVVTFRTFVCARPGCTITFRNDTGAPRKFHSEACRRIAENVRIAERRARSAGQTGSGRSREAQLRRLRGGLKIASEQSSIRQDAIDAMCRECEPEGLCRTADCPLRQFSPLPMAVREVSAPRTLATIRATTTQGPEARAKRRSSMARVHRERPEVMRRGIEAMHAPEVRARAQAAAAATIRTPEARRKASESGKARWARERLSATQRGALAGDGRESAPVPEARRWSTPPRRVQPSSAR